MSLTQQPFAERVALRLLDTVDHLVDVMRTVDPATLHQLQLIHASLESMMSALSDLQAELATIKASVAELAGRVASEIADLAAAIANNDPAATAAALASAQETSAALTALNAQLAGDDAPAPATP